MHCPTPPEVTPSRALRALSLLLPLLALLGLGALGPQRAAAATYTVTSNADVVSSPPSGTLRFAVSQAQAGDTIVFSGVTSITLAGTLQITQAITINGPRVTVDGAGQYTVFRISNTSGVVTLTGLTIQHGSAVTILSGGGVVVDAGADAALTDCTLTANSAPSGGGGLANSGTATLTGCTLTGNTAALGGGLASAGPMTTLSDCVLAGNGARGSVGPIAGGGVYVQSGSTATLNQCTLVGNIAKLSSNTTHAGQGGGVAVDGTATLTGCTLTGNSAVSIGGGILVNTSATATVTGCTLTGNVTYYFGNGAGIADSGSVSLTDDILYGDEGGSDEIDGLGTTSLLNSDVEIGQLNATPNFAGDFNADPEFVSSTDLHLKAGSPCAGTGSAATGNGADLDGRPRPTPGFSAPSIGAYEAAPTDPYSLVVENAGDGGTVTFTDASDSAHNNVPYALPMSLRADVQCADDYAGDTAAVTFDPAVFTSKFTIPLSSALGALTLSQPMSITGPAPGVAIDGGYDHAAGSGGVRIFDVTAGTSADLVALSGLTIQNGNAGSDTNGGGGLLNGGAVALTGCALTGNVATNGGGLSNAAGSAATLTNCVLTNNSASAGGGLINVGTATVTECTFTGNSASSGGGGGLTNFATVLLTDDILYGDGGEIANSPGGTTTATYSDIQGGYPGTGNFAADPQFVSPSAPAVRPGSPAVGAGTPSAPNNSYSPYDITGATRDATHPTVGAYEGTGIAANVQLRTTGNVTYGTTTTLTATVTVPIGGTAPTGSVAFSYTAPGSATPVTFDTVALTAGGTQASASTTAFAVPGGSALPGGQYTVTAAYLPDNPRFLTNVSPNQRVDVQPATPVVTVTDNGPNPSVYGQSVSVTVTVAPPAGLTGAATPTGSVTLHGVSGSMTLGSNGSATFTTSALPVGTDTLSASYTPGGDPNYQNAVSPNPQVTQTVNKAMVSAASVAWGSRTSPLTAGSSLLPTGRHTDVPWLGITSFTVTLNAPEALAAGDVSVKGITVANYGPVTVSGSGPTYTVTLARPVSAADRVTLTIGNADIATLTGTLPVLPGDVSDDGAVNASDLTLDHNAFGTSSVFADINGDAQVNINDYTLIRGLLGTKLP